MCESGLHASERLIDALQYAPGPIICRVECGGEIERDTDKLICRERTILWRVEDGGTLLKEFARKCALDVAHLWDMPAIVRQYLETGDKTASAAARATARAAASATAWATASDAASAAARAAASATAWATASAAARDAASAAARAAASATASATAWDAARDAARAWDAARDAAWAKQNDMLTALVEAAALAAIDRAAP